MSHTVKSFDAELDALDSLVAQMGGQAERLLSEAVAALEKRDTKRAEAAADADRKIDELERRIQDEAVLVITRRQPVANDLRHIMTTLKIAGDLERIGDLAKNIAKRARAIAGETHPIPVIGGLRHLSELAMRQLNDALDAFSAKDQAKALEVRNSDASLDALYNSVFRDLLTYMMEDPRNIDMCTHLLFGAKNMERIGDHATNIAEAIYYSTTGKMLVAERPKSDDTSSMTVGSKPG